MAREGDLAPGGGVATFVDIDINFALNEVGEVAFAATLSDGRVGFWLRRAAGLVPIVLDGQLAPGAGGRTFTLAIRTMALNRSR